MSRVTHQTVREEASRLGAARLRVLADLDSRSDLLHAFAAQLQAAVGEDCRLCGDRMDELNDIELYMDPMEPLSGRVAVHVDCATAQREAMQ